MTVLENISSKYIDKFSDIVHTFLWGTGNARIPFNILFCDKGRGRLKLVDLVHKQNALKAQWLFRITRNYFFTEIIINSLVP